MHTRFRSLSFSAALLFAFAMSALHAATPVESRITAATAYLDRAVVTRTAALDLAAGEQELVFEKLPATLVDDSLQVAGRGSAQVTILEVVAKPQWLVATPNERVRALEDQIKELQKQIRVLNDRAGVLDRQAALISRIAEASTTPPPSGGTGTPPPRPSVAEWQQLLAFNSEAFEKLASERQKLDTEREGLNAQIQALQQQLNELRGARGKNIKNVTVRVNVATAGKLDVTLGYTVPNAGWSPTYDARFSTTDRALTLGYFGVVRQNTGEDWKGVDLTLSTARPSLGGGAPELQPWIVQQEQPMVTFSAPAEGDALSSVRARKSMAGAPAPAAAPMDAALEVREAVQQAATVDTQATSATFRIGAKADVPSDNAPHKVGITTVSLAAELAYQTTPKLLPAAFLNAKVANSSEFPVLAGPMAVFLDGTFVANAGLKAVMPGEKFDLALGADDGIRVERKLVNRFTEDLGIVSKQIRVTYEVKFTVTNNKKSAEKITLKDQLPLSRHEKIEVKQIDPDAKALKPDDQGVLTWNLDLKPAEKREITLKFSVTHPRDFPVTGLE